MTDHSHTSTTVQLARVVGEITPRVGGKLGKGHVSLLLIDDEDELQDIGPDLTEVRNYIEFPIYDGSIVAIGHHGKKLVVIP